MTAFCSFFRLFLITYSIFIGNSQSFSLSPALITSETDAIKVNKHFTSFTESNTSFQNPHPDITILSTSYFMCVWSYSFAQESNIWGQNTSTTVYSNDIFANLYRISDGKNMVSNEFQLNAQKGYSQDTPSSTTLFNETSHEFDKAIIVWESQYEDDDNPHILYDGIFGRIITWDIRNTDNIRYVQVTSPTSSEFPISQSVDLVHFNPDVIPIYGTNKFIVTWTSKNNNNQLQYMIFIRIYQNNGKPLTNEIQIFENDLLWKKYPKIVPLLYNYTLLTWTQQYVYNSNDQGDGIAIYGMVIDQFGSNVLQHKYEFIHLHNDQHLMNNLYNDSISCIAHLYSNYFIIGWEGIDRSTIHSGIYQYNININDIIQISNITSLFLHDTYLGSESIITNPSMHNIMDETYLLEDGLDAKVSLCYTLKSQDSSSVFCKILEISIWEDDGSYGSIYSKIEIITDNTLINTNQTLYHQHSSIRITSESILRAQADFEDDPSFFVVWSNKKEDIGYDVYTKVLSVVANPDYNNGSILTTKGPSKAHVSLSHLNSIIIGVVFGILLLIILICVANHYWNKYKHKVKPKVKMHQIGEESDDDEDDNLRDNTLGANDSHDSHTDGYDDDGDDQNTTILNENVQMTGNGIYD